MRTLLFDLRTRLRMRRKATSRQLSSPPCKIMRKICRIWQYVWFNSLNTRFCVSCARIDIILHRLQGAKIPKYCFRGRASLFFTTSDLQISVFLVNKYKALNVCSYWLLDISVFWYIIIDYTWYNYYLYKYGRFDIFSASPKMVFELF